MTHMFKLSRRTARLRAASMVVALALVSACDNADRIGPTDEIPTATPTPNALEPADSPPGVEGPSLYTAAAAPGVPFGIFGLPMDQYYNTALWTGSLKHLSPGNSAIVELNAARKYGARVVISMAGGRSTYKNADGTFSMAKWKANVDKWKSVAIASFINDGTIIGHYLIDEPNWAAGWGGKRVSHAELEEMARYSKSLWPSLATTVRIRPGGLIGYTWRYLDFAWSQWEGPLHVPSYGMTAAAFRDREIADAQRAGVKLMFGMNFLDGGDGRSRIAGTYANSTTKTVNRWQMSAAEIEQAGAVFAGASYGCGVISWAWSSSYPAHAHLTASQLAGIRAFNSRSDVKTALARVSGIAKNRVRTSCKR